MSSQQGQNKGEMPVAEGVRLADLVNYQEGSVVSRTIVKRATGTVTLFAFDEGQWAYTWLRARGNTIEAGTSEIQRNIVGHFVLGLPKSY